MSINLLFLSICFYTRRFHFKWHKLFKTIATFFFRNPSTLVWFLSLKKSIICFCSMNNHSTSTYSDLFIDWKSKRNTIIYFFFVDKWRNIRIYKCIYRHFFLFLWYLHKNSKMNIRGLSINQKCHFNQNSICKKRIESIDIQRVNSIC
jgi:hypothetical protein